MDNVLSRVERDVVLRYLRDDSVPLVIQQSGSSTNVSTLIKEQFVVHNEGIILIKNPISDWMSHDYTDVEVRFYYKKRGLYFNSVLRRISYGMAIVIPAEIRKQADKDSLHDYLLTAVLFYSCAKQDDLHIKCCPRANYPLFDPFVWQTISSGEIKKLSTYFEEFTGGRLVSVPSQFSLLMSQTKKVLYLPKHHFPEKKLFPADLCIMFDELPNDFSGAVSSLQNNLYIPLDDNAQYCLACDVADVSEKNQSRSLPELESILALLPICRFLAEENQDIAKSNKDRIEPLSILFINEKLIVLGGDSSSVQFQSGQEYAIKISISTPIGFRDIFVTCSVSKLFSNYINKTCAVCVFTSLKPEDKRLLFEHTYKSIYR